MEDAEFVEGRWKIFEEMNDVVKLNFVKKFRENGKFDVIDSLRML